MNNNDDKYLDVIKTSDFTLASTLYCLGVDVHGIDKLNPKRVIFYFKSADSTKKLIEDYFNNRIRINPLEFDRAQREIRAQIHTNI